MALADYRLCDVCDKKVFYDANLNYQQGRTDWYNEPIDETNSIKYCGELSIGTKLDYLGDWAVICHECAKTHKCVVVPIAVSQELTFEDGLTPEDDKSFLQAQQDELRRADFQEEMRLDAFGEKHE